MTLDEWREVQATEPLTPAQLGAVLGQFTRLGVADRAERLAICAALLGLDDLGSTRDLTLGQAGSLYRMLLDVSDRDELPDITAAADEGQGDDDNVSMRVTIADVIMRGIAVLSATFRGIPAAATTEPDSTDSRTEGTRS